MQPSAAAAVTLAVLTIVFADRYPGAWIALWAVWAATTAAAVTNAARRAG
ncbi:hypothetical protein [Cellulosimicrobium cellulans]|nr:hypothetical protein [Cellulosimicrobium cellulans]